MCKGTVVLFLFVVYGASEDVEEDNRRLCKAIVEALQDKYYDNQLTFDLKKENQMQLNRTMSLLIKYIVKREVDHYRRQRPDAISRKVYSALIMKLVDIARDLPQDHSPTHRIDTAHRYYMSVESRDLHDEIADRQVFHAVSRLYDMLLTAPRILSTLGPTDDLTPRLLVRKLEELKVKPVHLSTLLLIQYHLRRTVNYAIKNNIVETLSAEPKYVGPKVISALKDLAALLLPVVEMLDIHLAHSSPMFKDTCSSTWLEAQIDSFAAIMRKRCASLMRRLRGSPNSILSVFSERENGPMLTRWQRLHAVVV